MPKKPSRHLPPEFQKQLDSARAMGSLKPFLSLLGRFGVGGDKFSTMGTELDALLAQAEELGSTPAAFEEYFASRGWLISESTSIDAAQEAIALAKQGEVQAGEDLLVATILGESLDFTARRIGHAKGFKERRDLIEEALLLTHAQRYLAAVPLLLIVADGAGQDYFNKSIFSEGVELTELNALAGHPGGLPAFIKEMCRTRKPITTKPLIFPYRNGIMHGRDLGYGNATVTAKCWSLLTNIADVIHAREAAEALQADPPEPEPTLRESLQQYNETKKFSAMIEEWKPRKAIDEPVDVVTTDECPFPAYEPETALFHFLKAWLANNYGEMGRRTVYYDNRPINRRAGQIREDLQDTTLTGARIVALRDHAAAVTEVDTRLSVSMRDSTYEEDFTFRLLCVDDDDGGATRIRGQDGACWRIMPNYQELGIKLRLRR